MDLCFSGLDSQLLQAFHQHLVEAVDYSEKTRNLTKKSYTTEEFDNARNLPKKSHAKATAATPADVMEHPDCYIVIVDMPGLKSEDMKVQVEEENVLVIRGERKTEEEKERAKYVRRERRVGKFMRKFVLPENANTDAISAVCQDGVLTVTVQKLPPPESKKPKTIEVQVA